MINIPPTYNTAVGNRSSVNKVKRRSVIPSNSADSESVSARERRNQIDRRKTKEEQRLMDRRNGAKRRRSSINLSV